MGQGKELGRGKNLDLEVQVAYRNIKAIFVSLSLLSIYCLVILDGLYTDSDPMFLPANGVINGGCTALVQHFDFL